MFLFPSKIMCWQAGQMLHSESYDLRLFTPKSCSCFSCFLGRVVGAPDVQDACSPRLSPHPGANLEVGDESSSNPNAMSTYCILGAGVQRGGETSTF